MKRDPIKDWRRAIRRRGVRAGGLKLAARRAEEGAAPAVAVPLLLCAPVTDFRALRRTRRLQPRDWCQDLGQAIRVLQRHNRLLRARFGVGWVEVVSMVQGEAARRGMSAATLARVLAAGLRSDAAPGHA